MPWLLHRRLDPGGRGYCTVRDWIGDAATQRQMEAFTRLYCTATRGADGRPKHLNECRSAHMAVQVGSWGRACGFMCRGVALGLLASQELRGREGGCGRYDACSASFDVR
jgi:hypothetical protein